MNIVLALALLGGPVAVRAQTIPPARLSSSTLTLEDSVRLALERSTTVLKTGNQARTAGVALLQSYGRFLPDLEANGNASRQWGRVFLTVASPTLEDTINYGLDYAVATRLNLFNGFADYGTFKAASARDKAAQLSLTRARQAVSLDVTQSYLQVALDEQLISIDESSLRLSREREAYLAEQTRVGAKSIVDLYQQQAAASLADSALIAARNKARDDLFVLLFKLRLDIAQDYRIAGVSLDSATAPGEQDESSLLAYAFAHRPDVQAARDLVAASAGDLTAARAGYFPKAELSFGAASSSRRYQRELLNGVDSLPPDQPSIGAQLSNHVNYAVAIGLNWLLFDRFVTRLAVARASEAARDADIDYSDARTRTQADVRQAWGDYRAAAAQVSATADRLAAAAEAFEAMQARYAVQASSFLDLITAQDVLTQARAARVQALIQLLLQRHALDYALGNGP